MPNVQVGVPPVLADLLGVLAAARVEEAGEELVGGVIQCVGIGVVGVECKPMSRPLREINRARMVHTAAKRWIGRDIGLKAEWEIDIVASCSDCSGSFAIREQIPGGTRRSRC